MKFRTACLLKMPSPGVHFVCRLGTSDTIFGNLINT